MTGADGTRYVDPASDAQGRNYSIRYHDGDLIVVDIIPEIRDTPAKRRQARLRAAS